MTSHSSALVLFSGGQDSTACLAWALERFAHVETVGFDYGQRHAVELECRLAIRKALPGLKPGWATRLGEDHVVDLTVLGALSDTALTRHSAIAFAANGLPNTFVPGRNLMFLTFAAAIACRRGITAIIGGMCETDYSGYPDCRDDAIKAMQLALNIGMGQNFVLHTPLMWLDKAQIWELSEEIGGAALTNLIVEESHTCYLGDRSERHDWGHGCGQCPSCALRAEGFAAFKARRHAATHP
jgi:7-cyano-7-deazaguanine synthase